MYKYTLCHINFRFIMQVTITFHSCIVFSNSIFSRLSKPLSRAQFQYLVYMCMFPLDYCSVFAVMVVTGVLMVHSEEEVLQKVA